VVIKPEVAWGLKGLQDGTATPEQQRAIIGWIVKAVCGYDADLFYPDNARSTDFALGKRWVASEILRAYNLTPEQIALLKERDNKLLGVKDDDEMPTT
jgi:hypothetical protein